jgi:hypothetical protein
VQITFGLRRQTSQFLGSRRTVAQLRNQRFGASDHGHIGGVARPRPRDLTRVWLSTNTRHLSVPHYLTGNGLAKFDRSGQRSASSSSCSANLNRLTGRSYLAIVYRLITN